MELIQRDRRLLHALEGGLPLVPRPFGDIAVAAHLSEAEVIEGIGRLVSDGTIRRFGLVVRHREIGYRANAMVVWDVPDPRVNRIGAQMGSWPSVTLCYRRARRPPRWPYNLYCMIHGKNRKAVRGEIDQLAAAIDLESVPRVVLFSRRRFKQSGAHYRPVAPAETEKS